MDENQDDAYAARRAELERQFQALPPAGSTPYWQRLEQPDASQRLPLEVLARCFRERNGAGARQDAERICATIMQRIRVRVGQWSRYIAGQAKAGGKPQLQQDLEQECHMKLFEELAGDGPTFLLESFAHKLDRICKHVAHRVMEREGEWTREGVEKSTRVPRDQVESLQAQPKGDGEMPLDAHVVDARAQEALEQVELSDLYDLIRKLPDDQKQILIDRFYRDRAQQETAADLGVTDRTIRNRLVTILRDLRARYQGGEEVTHD